MSARPWMAALAVLALAGCKSPSTEPGTSHAPAAQSSDPGPAHHRGAPGGAALPAKATVPAEIASRIETIRRAVAVGTVAELRPHLAAQFFFSFGDAPSAEEGIRQLEQSAELRAELLKAIDAGCAKQPDGKTIVCPPDAMREDFFGHRATFEAKEGWKMTAFIAGD